MALEIAREAAIAADPGKGSFDDPTADEVRRFQLHLIESGESICNRNAQGAKMRSDSYFLGC
jgi:hypothetical protein